MAEPVLIEICVESLDLAVAAERGGADRIELCHDLDCGGVTPSADLMLAVRHRLQIPIHAMIRPRAGDFHYSEAEIEAMERDIAAVKNIGLDGIVLGVLDPSHHIDVKRTRALVELAHPLPVTFHRAFDECVDVTVALEAAIETGATRILTSAGKANAAESLPGLAQLVRAAANRIVILPGGGVRAENVERILRTTGALEIHSSLGASPPDAIDSASFEDRVRKFKRATQNAG